MEKAQFIWNIVPIKKALQPPMEYTPMGYSPNKKKHDFVMVSWQKIKKCNIKDAMSIKISFMNYMKWVRAMLPLVILTSSFFGGGFFLAIFSFYYHCQLVKVQLQQKFFGGRGLHPPSPSFLPGFYGPVTDHILLHQYKIIQSILLKNK